LSFSWDFHFAGRDTAAGHDFVLLVSSKVPPFGKSSRHFFRYQSGMTPEDTYRGMGSAEEQEVKKAKKECEFSYLDWG